MKTENYTEASSSAETQSSYAMKITSYSITWFFDREYQHGQFANGDYWVVGPVRIVDISPRSNVVNRRIINGSMINPVSGNEQGYDSEMMDTTYRDYLNAGRPNGQSISQANPLVIPGSASLISTISVSDTAGRSQLSDAGILTVLESAPAEGSFRPPYCGSDKTIRFNIGQLNYSLLANLAPVYDTPSLSDVEKKFERPWIDHIMNSFGHGDPVNNMPQNGRDLADVIGIASLLLHLEFTNDQKSTLTIRLAQIGIDSFGIIQNGGSAMWSPDGIHNQGRKWPILFAGIMLNDMEMKSIGERSGEYMYSSGYGPGNIPPDYIQFQEDCQTFYVTADDVTRTHSSSWEPDTGNGPAFPYKTEDIGLPEWGVLHSSDPYRDNKSWTAKYRSVNASVWAGFILSVIIMEATVSAKTLWNNRALFDYVDRYMGIGRKGDYERCWSRFTEEMWDTYRRELGDWCGYIGGVFTKDNRVVTNCINAGKGYDGKTGTIISKTTSTRYGFAVNSSIIAGATGFISDRYEIIDENHYRLYGDCVEYGIVKE